MVGVMTLNCRKNVSQQLKKVAIFDIKPLRLFFSLREFSFSLIWTAKISLRSILTTVRSRKMKILSRKRNFACELFYLSTTLFQPLGTYFFVHGNYCLLHCFTIKINSLMNNTYIHFLCIQYYARFHVRYMSRKIPVS